MQVSKLALIAALALSSAGCQSLSGYPHDPQLDNALGDSRALYFSKEAEACYNAAPAAGGTVDVCSLFPGIKSRQDMRDTIVLNRVHIYDMEFNAFVRALSADANTISVGTDFAAFALNGLAATTGNAGTKAALAAASTGVLAANGAIDKDIFYQKTIPALVAQMEADRTKAEATIVNALKEHSDAEYSLARATLDLDALSRAGSINVAVANITEKATTEKKAAEADLAAPYRDTTDCRTDECIKIRAWLLKGDANVTALVNWSNQHVPKKYLDVIPFPEALADTPGDVLDVLRLQAIKDLSIN